MSDWPEITEPGTAQWVDFDDADDEEVRPTYLETLRAALVDSAGLDAIEPPRPLIAGVLQLDSIAWLQGKPGHGKSFVGLDMAGCVGTGTVWQLHQVTQGAVLYVIAEGVSGIKQRVRAWESAWGKAMTGVRFLPIAVQAALDGHWAALVALAEELKPALVIIDTQARVTVGSEENSARDMGVFVDRVEQIRLATGACVLVIHHEGRAGEHMRGSTAIEGAATTIIRASKAGDVVTISNPKQKDAATFEDFDLRLTPVLNSAIYALIPPSFVDNEYSILQERWLSIWWERFESEEVSISSLVKAEVVAESTFHRKKYSLIKAGIISKEGTDSRPRYRLTKDPLA